MAKKENAGLTILLIVLAFFFLFNVLSPDNLTVVSTATSDDGIMKVRVATTDTPNQPLSISPFVIVPSSQTVEKGEVASFDDFQDIFVSCNSLVGEFKLKNTLGLTVSSANTNLGQAGFMTAFYNIDIFTSLLASGSYTVESNWRCDGNLLGKDGDIGGTTEPNTASLTVNSICDNGEERCIGDSLQICSNNNWANQGQVINKCGFLGNNLPDGSTCTSDEQCSSDSCQNFQCVSSTQCNPGEERCISNQMFQRCGSDGVWDNFGLVVGKCGWTGGNNDKPDGASCVEDSECQSTICANFQCTPSNSQCISNPPEKGCFTESQEVWICNERGFRANQGRIVGECGWTGIEPCEPITIIPSILGKTEPVIIPNIPCEIKNFFKELFAGVLELAIIIKWLIIFIGAWVSFFLSKDIFGKIKSLKQNKQALTLLSVGVSIGVSAFLITFIGSRTFWFIAGGILVLTLIDSFFLGGTGRRTVRSVARRTR